ncbi:MAG: hypothetical protein IT373_13930 [Polyangiaceae bacterium]|nr:hypothetical protein [Polyangiaceae bacterium]
MGQRDRRRPGAGLGAVRVGGRLYDADTGWVRFGARDYDPDVGRWTTRNPIGFGGGEGR